MVHGLAGFLLASCRSFVQAETQPTSRPQELLGIHSLPLIAHACDSVQAFSACWVELASPGTMWLVAIGTKVNSGPGVLTASPGCSGGVGYKCI